jgi:hypothetical protein
LKRSAHHKGAHGYGSLARANGSVRFHHNLWAHKIGTITGPVDRRLVEEVERPSDHRFEAGLKRAHKASFGVNTHCRTPLGSPLRRSMSIRTSAPFLKANCNAGQASR